MAIPKLPCAPKKLTDVVTHTCNPSIWEVEAGRSGVQGQPQLHREFKTYLGYRKPFKQTKNLPTLKC